MDGIRNVQALIDPWWSYFVYCFNGDPLDAVCMPFWERALAGVVLVGFIATAFGAWKYFRYRQDVRAAGIAEWEREQSDFGAANLLMVQTM